MAHICEKFTTTVIHRYALLICDRQNEKKHTVSTAERAVARAKDLELPIAVAAEVARDHRNEGCRQPDRDVLKNTNLAGKQDISNLNGCAATSHRGQSQKCWAHVPWIQVAQRLEVLHLALGTKGIGEDRLSTKAGHCRGSRWREWWFAGYRQPRTLTQVLKEGIQRKRLVALPDCTQAHLFATKNHAANGLNAVDGHHEQNPAVQEQREGRVQRAWYSRYVRLDRFPDLTV